MKNKSYINGLRTYYHKTPTQIYDMGLSIEAIALYNYLACGSEDFNPSVRLVSRKLKVGPNRVRKAYAELEVKNVIKCYHKGFKGVTKKYEFIPVDFWKVRKARRSSNGNEP